MDIELKPKPEKDIKPGPIPQQTAFWARIKSKQGWQSHAFDITSYPSGQVWSVTGESTTKSNDLLVITTSLGQGAQLAYIPFGPKIIPRDEMRGRWLENISEKLKDFLPSSTILIRYDLAWESPWVHDENRYNDQGKWLGPPEPYVREMRMNFDTEKWKLRKSPSDNLPSHTIFLDLRKNEEELLKHMKPKTRYNIRLSRRKGVKVRRAGIEDLPVWYDLYRETSKRNGIVLNNMDYFKTVLKTRAADTNSPADVQLLIAEYGGKPLAAMFLVISGDRGTYLFGASSSSDRHLMAPYALQWEAMKISKKMGCNHYDLFGISIIPDTSHPLYGLYRFKSGFGGKIFHRQGCWDYLLDENRYEQFRIGEMTGKGYHL